MVGNSGIALALLLLWPLSTGCGGSGQPARNDPPSPSPESEPPAPGAPEPATQYAPPPPDAPAPAYPVGAIGNAPPCDVRFMVRLSRTGARYVVHAFAFNTTDHAVTLKLADRCPLGPIEFSGLPGEYDYYDGCTKGACASRGRTIDVPIAAHQEVEITSVEIEPAGRGCNPPLPRRRFDVSFSLPKVENACGPGTVAIDLAPPPPPAPPTKRVAPKARVDCPPMPLCGIYCPGPMAHDAAGCPLCACARFPYDGKP